MPDDADSPPPPPLVPPPLAPLPQMALARGRLHELTGPARHTLAALAARAAEGEGPVLWLRPAWLGERLCAQGLGQFMADPGALIMMHCPKPVDVLWGMEEALRSGAVALVLGEIVDPPDLRQVRRLHLAAAEGLARNRNGAGPRLAPLGAVLACERADSRIPGVESRWALCALPPEPGYRSAPDAWRLDRQLMRAEPPCDWRISAPPPGLAVVPFQPPAPQNRAAG